MNKFLLSTLALLLTAFGLSAQVTTSSLTGTIKDSKETLIGATVKATHQPTGTVYGSSTKADGRFTIPNIRVGGPYLIEVTYVGYEPAKFEGINIKLGEPFVLNVTLQATGTTLREVSVVAANPNSVLNADRTGSTTNISRAQLQSLPTITRSVNDMTRLTPQANGTSIGGGSYRSNNFTVDGANFNNQFGIGQNIPANGSPISLDAIDQISINVTPFDVRQTGFTGASINAVTRSGTNNPYATAFFTLRNEKQQGDKVEANPSLVRQQYDQKQYGVSVGLPIIKNKLFFFGNVEYNKETRPGQARYTSGAVPYPTTGNTLVSRPTSAFLNDVSAYLRSKYGYETGVFQGYSNKSYNDKLFARLDWNISSKHSLNVRYNQVESNVANSLSNSTTNSGTTYTGSRTGNNALHFANSNYGQEANLYSGTAELNSSFGSKFSNVLRASYSHQNDPRSSTSSPFPLVDILEGGTPITTFGYEPFTYGNLRDVNSKTLTDELTMSLGKHSVLLGAQIEKSKTKNGFQRFGTGYYVFNSWADFVNGAKPNNYAVTYSLNADGSQAFPSFKFEQYSAYIQDEFTASDRLKFTAGLRVEKSDYPDLDEVKTHPLLASLTFAQGQKLNSGELPESKVLLSPRFGFNWNVKGDRSLQVRGGTGIFTGRIPFVWIVSHSDVGLLQFLQTYAGTANTPTFNPSIAPNLLTPKVTVATAGETLQSAINLISPDFQSPQTWKSSLAFDTKLPFGITGTLEGIYNKDIHAVYAKNVNLVDPTSLNVSGYADNRPIYPSAGGLPTTAAAAFARQLNSLTGAGKVATTAATTNSSGFTTVLLDNTEGGHYWSVSAQLSKQLSKGLSVSAAYTRSGARNYGDAGGDQMTNVWTYPVTSSNSNIPTLSYTSNVLPSRVIATLNYRKEYLKNLATQVSFFYEGAASASSNASRFSYTYTTDFNRDGVINDLIYVPKDASEITFVAIPAGTSGYRAAGYTAQEQSDIFFNYVEQDDYLKTRKGKYAERNGAQYPWRNQVDFKFIQDVFKTHAMGKTKNTFQFTWDIFNLGNLLNSDWGVYKFTQAFSVGSNSNAIGLLVPQNVGALNANGTTKPTFRMATANNEIVSKTFVTNNSITSTYFMQFGFRMTFQ
ncbi:TonB-dependent receptor [Hufsiella ginkgonis]|uniref:TonB-dependent receptor n=1 Tax=Hufsiella ginkgonis TaxID=2695274 RepID=A0A7K1XWJ1_9SPHI|nr:carboxypeptidase regulatory-like domain-containing protein [Hufsiella ginkgonis]MXV15373.1 TonB-dependent receptor [Hufsiella ginkgonis]